MKGKFDPTVGIVVCSRVASSRLPQKALRKIAGKPAIQILIENLQRQYQYDIVLAIPQNPKDDELEQIGLDCGINVYRGEDDSPLHRLYEVAKKFGFQHVVRITHDDILIDPILLLNQVKHHLSARNPIDYTYMSKCPDGVAGEVISTSALAQVVREVGQRPVEHVSYYVRRSDKFRIFEYYPPYEYQHQFRLTMDYEQDLTLLRILFSMLSLPFSTLDVLNLLRNKNNRHLTEINRAPEITVYTCCFNQGKYLRESLESIKAQSWTDFELIIIDDCSTDNTPAIILEWISEQSHEFQRKVRFHRNKTNKGLPWSSNKAVHLSRGKYITRLDSDDIMGSEFLYQMRTFLDENRSLSAVFCGYREIDEAGEILTDVPKNEARHPGCSMLRAGAVKEVLYKEDLQHFEGLEFIKRFQKYFQIGDLAEILWMYRQHKESKSKNNTDEREKVHASITHRG